jgi:antitoxin (DNA-binding transcriptional repressor) of toxin-antitoxin stability system
LEVRVRGEAEGGGRVDEMGAWCSFLSFHGIMSEDLEAGRDIMTKTLDMGEAAAQWQDVMACVSVGTEVLLTREGTVVARIVPEPAVNRPRIGGLHEGAAWISPDFDEPLADEFWLGKA